MTGHQHSYDGMLQTLILQVHTLALLSTFGKFFDLKLLHSSINEYMAIESSGYLCVNILLALIGVWLDGSQISWGDVQLNRPVVE